MSIREPSTPELLEQTFNETLINFKDLYEAEGLIDPQEGRVDHGLDITEYRTGVIEFPVNFNSHLETLGLPPSVEVSVIRGVSGVVKNMQGVKFAPRTETNSDSGVDVPEYLILNHMLGRHIARSANEEYSLDVPELGSDIVDLRPAIEGWKSMSQANLSTWNHIEDLLHLPSHNLRHFHAVALKGLSSYLPVFKQAFQTRKDQESPES